MNSDQILDVENGGAYGVVAGEYYDPVLHPTCYNFNRLSRLYIARHLSSATTTDGLILEVGAGDSSAAPILMAAGRSLRRLVLSDLSCSMLANSVAWQDKGAQLLVGDAEQLARWAPQADCVVAGLGDPYNTTAFWRQVAAIVAALGRVIFTTPSFEWASRFRGDPPSDKSAAEFLTKEGETLQMPSFIPPLATQIAMIEDAGFVVLNFEALGVAQLGNDVISPKLNGVGLSESLVWGFLAMKPIQPLPLGYRSHWRASGIASRP